MRIPSTLGSRRARQVASTTCCAWCQGDGVARVAGVVVVCACRPFDLDAAAGADAGPYAGAPLAIR